MNILAIDSAHGICSAAFFNGKEVAAECILDIERGQAEVLIPMVQDVLKKAKAGFCEVDVIAVTVGPGSFTGVRVGLAAANGIALAADLPMIGVSVLQAVAFKAVEKNPDGKMLCVVLETKRDDFYVQRFLGQKAVDEPAVRSAEEIKSFENVIFAGNGVERLILEIGTVPVLDLSMPTAGDIARFAVGMKPEKKYPAPLYLREAEVCLCQK